MYWIALLPSLEEERAAWSWRALRYTPRVACVDEALLLEVSASQRLWGGRKNLLRSLIRDCEPLACPQWGQGTTSLNALAMLRMKLRGQKAPTRLPEDFPLDVLSAAREHAATLERTGCRNWGDLRALPRAGVARRFGAGLLDALDAAYGDIPEQYPWVTLPEDFDMKVELVALATSAPELMWAAQRLLTQMQVWLQARHRGVLALELEWTLDLRRLNGVRLPSHEQLTLRTAQPTQDIAHLRRLVSEHLSRSKLAAPANYLRLRSIETLPWGGADKSLLPEDNVSGERLHQLIERLSARLGESSVMVPQAVADHRPERMQRWKPARQTPQAAVSGAVDALYPPWLLSQPLRLEVKAEKPQYLGPLRLLAGPARLETGWWDPDARGPAMRDYFIARSEEAGLLWIYRERLSNRRGHAEPIPVRWFLQGIYA